MEGILFVSVNVCMLVTVYGAIYDMKLDVCFVKMSHLFVLLFQGVHTVKTLFPTSPQQQSSLKRTARQVLLIHSFNGVQTFTPSSYGVARTRQADTCYPT